MFESIIIDTDLGSSTDDVAFPLIVDVIENALQYLSACVM